MDAHSLAHLATWLLQTTAAATITSLVTLAATRIIKKI